MAAGLTGSRIALAGVLLLAAASLAAAAPNSANRAKLVQPAPANPRQVGNNTFQFALQNGMQVLVIPDHRAPVVTQMLWFRVGAVDDPPGISGLAHFFEHMMFRGTKAGAGRRLRPDHRQQWRRDQRLHRLMTTPPSTSRSPRTGCRWPWGWRPTAWPISIFPIPMCAPERDVVLEERRMRVDNEPQSLMAEQMRAALHLSHPYGRPVIGWAEEVRRIDRVSAQDFYDHHYAPNNAILVIAGDVTPEEVRADGAGRLRQGAGARALAPRAEFAEPPRLAETRMTIVRPDARVPLFKRIYRVPSYAQGMPGQAEGLETYAQLLGGDQTSRALSRAGGAEEARDRCRRQL